MITKPPLGIKPQRIWLWDRALDLSAVIHEYLLHGEIPKYIDTLDKWAGELKMVTRMMMEEEKR